MNATPLDDLHTTFKTWLGAEYDLDAINATLAAIAVERLDGDPLWLLLVSGSGNAKTETVQAAIGAGAIIVSTITGEGALLSGSPKKDQGPRATGGLLREMGERGVIVIKDVTSILSMSGDARNQVLAALREVYDGKWIRRMGVDGGRTLEWIGRIVVVGAVTTAWDQAHTVVSAMGDRFVLLRMDSTKGRLAAGAKAISNTGSEVEMRDELSQAVGKVLADVKGKGVDMTESEAGSLLAAANVVTTCRTSVVHDYKGDVVDANAPEMPTRFAKQLAQVVRGAAAIGMGRDDSLRLAIRCARDSMPPLRLLVLEDVAAHPGSSTADVTSRVQKPRPTVDRTLQALHILGALTVESEDSVWRGKETTIWRYSLAEGINPAVLCVVPSCKPIPDSAIPPVPQHRDRGGVADSGMELACQTCGRELITALDIERGCCPRCANTHLREGDGQLPMDGTG